MYIYIYCFNDEPIEGGRARPHPGGYGLRGCDQATEQPGSTPELVVAVKSPTNDGGGAEGMEHHEGQLLHIYA